MPWSWPVTVLQRQAYFSSPEFTDDVKRGSRPMAAPFCILAAECCFLPAVFPESALVVLFKLALHCFHRLQNRLIYMPRKLPTDPILTRSTLVFGVLFVSVCVLGSQLSQAASKPSIDLLLARVNAYWTLLAQGKKQLAVEYVRQDYRKNFFNRLEPAFSKPRITALDLSGKPNEVWVTTTVKRDLTSIGRVDWPVNEKWVYTGANWHVVIADSTTPFSSGHPASLPASRSPDDIEHEKAHLREILQFERREVDFGPVREGERAQSALKYRFQGNDILSIRTKNLPPGLSLIGTLDDKLQNGQDQEIKLEWRPEHFDYDGKVQVPFSIFVRNGDLEVPYEFELRGSFYSPLSISPGRLLFAKGESEKELEVRNNSHSEVTVQSIYSAGVKVLIQQIPLVLPAGGSARLKVRVLEPVAGRNRREVFSLILAAPVEGMTSLVAAMVLNYEEQEQKDDEAVPQELEEWMRKNLPPR